MTLTEIGLASVLTITITGCVLGVKDRITVFRNYDDLGLVFLAVAPLFIGFITAISWILIPAAIASVGLVGWLIVRTWQDNASVWKLAIALVTKLMLSVLFIAFVWDLLAPSGKTQLDRAKQRGFAAAMLAILTPVVYRLVKSKTGVFTPRQVFAGTRRGLTNGS
jgi:Na+/H+-translocating membrane pyrophosphatase